MKTLFTITFQCIFFILASMFSNRALSLDNFQPRLNKNLGAFQPRLNKNLIQNPVFSSENFQVQLDDKLYEYRILSKSPNVKKLFELNRDIKNLVSKIEKVYGDNPSATKKLWLDEYEEIGLYIGHYSDTIGYSDKMLVEAHNLNPNSSYRKYTLFTEILGEGTSHGLGEMPNIKAAKKYLKEFPNGPYAEDTHAILGFFYDDLYKIINRYIENEKHEKDYLDNCFEPFISKLPYKKQLKSAREKAILHLSKAIAMNPKHKNNQYRLDSLKFVQATPIPSDEDGWHWCAD